MMRYEYLKSVESSARTYAASFDHVFERGMGARVTNGHGKEFIDCLAGAGALPLGHNHPEVQAAVLDFLSSGQLQQALDLSTPAKFEFVRELFSLLPDSFRDEAKILFCAPSGSDAVEAALKLTRFATGRQPIVSFQGAYHGMTSGALGAMGNAVTKEGVGAIAYGMHFAPFPDPVHCPFHTDGRDTDLLSANYLRTILSDPQSGIPKPAAVIVEIVQGEGGCRPASVKWLQMVRQLTADQGVPLIVDEVQTGIARTGRMFAFEFANIIPDVLVLSKAIGGGYPLAVVVYNRALDQLPPGRHAGTFRGNQIAMVAGRATINVIRRDELDRQAVAIGASLMSGLNDIAGRHPVLVDVRGRGLMLGVEVARRGRGSQPSQDDGQLAKRIKLAACRNGLLIETGGPYGSVLRFLPPLIIDKDDAGSILDRFEVAVKAVEKEDAHLRSKLDTSRPALLGDLPP
jgi:diaminobutyrate-2-oxoglutarate transaminase